MSLPPKLPELFCTSQALSLLHPELIPRPLTVKDCLSGDRFWDEKHAGRGGEELSGSNPWQPMDRSALVRSLSPTGHIKRLAVVCAGGYGKSANLEYLEGMLTRAGKVVFRFELDEETGPLPDNGRDFWAKTLPDLFGQGDNAALTRDKASRVLEKCRASGRLVLLFDSIDQGTPPALTLVGQVLADPAWYGSPVVLSARPHAVYDRWSMLIKPDVSKWHFLRVEPLAVGQRELLLGPNMYVSAQDTRQEQRREQGAALYQRLPAGGRELMANPRNIEFARRMAGYGEPLQGKQYKLEEMRTASDLFTGSVDFTVRLGAKATGAERLGEKRNQEKLNEPADFALDLLAAFAHVMYARLYEQSGAGDTTGGPFRPNVSAIPHAEMGKVRVKVTKLLKGADLVDADYTVTHLEKVDLPALNALNAGVQYDLLDKDEKATTNFRWHDRTLQEFLVAWWLAKYATEQDCDRLRGWRYDDGMTVAKSLYSPLWGFLVEMPRAVRTAKWFAAVGVLFEPINDDKVGRCCEMIYRCCQTFETMIGEERKEADAMVAEWQAEFARMVGPVADSLRQDEDFTHFKRCPRNPADDGQPFQMGAADGEKNALPREFPRHPVVVSRFLMSRGPVTNEQYELFDPGHLDEREWKDEKDIARHPVVSVNWWEAWCFARWVGAKLPTEAQWEYAARGGTTTQFYWGETLNGTEANCDGNHPYGPTTNGPYLERTTAVGEYEGRVPEHPWGLVDVHGNVSEWCLDWYDEGFYDQPEATRPNPECLKGERLHRVLRGGTWHHLATNCRAAYRHWGEPSYRHYRIGFRLVLPFPSSPRASASATYAGRSAAVEEHKQFFGQ